MGHCVARDQSDRKPLSLRLLCCAFLSAAITMPCCRAEKRKMLSASEVDQSVFAALSHLDVTQPRILSHIDLTKPFNTATQWTLVIVENTAPPPANSGAQEGHGRIFVCLVQAVTPDCSQRLYPPRADVDRWFAEPFHLFDDRIVHAGPEDSSPLLLVKVCSAYSGDGDCLIATALYRYDRRADRFARVFLNTTGRNNNQETRFVERGPLQGDAIVNYPTQSAPYTYWIEVYRPEASGQYQRILRYRGHTGYNDGNPLAVIDSEMPEILRHMGLWKAGDPLPRPSRLPQGCSHLFMRHSEEWCKE